MRRVVAPRAVSLLAAGGLAFHAANALAATYYVAPAPGGNDANAGSEAQPFASMNKAQTVAVGGDTVYFKGGTYAYTAGTSACSSQTASISGVVLSKSGSAGKLIQYFAAPGEKPILDFDGIRDSCRIKGILVSGSYIHLKGFELRGVRQNNNLNHESWGVWIQGSNNVFEALDVHDIMGAGIFIQRGGNNLVLNCDSHDNLDELTSNGAGESADGFGCHVSAGETGNVFRGCRAWWNADDGFDFINSDAACLVEGSWAWYNGYRPGTMTGIGNGNGFKGGGYGADPAAFPAQPAKHTVQSCLAVGNRAAGFYANHHPVELFFYNNTSYGNHPDFNMLGMNASGADITVGVYRNNLAFGGTLFSNRNGADDASNSWTLSDVSVSAADFQSVAADDLGAPRQADGSLPNLPNFHLAAGSDLIDKGAKLTLPFTGSAPDLGAFESGLMATGGTASAGAGSGGTTSSGGRAAGGTNPSAGNGSTLPGGTPNVASGGRSTANGGAPTSAGAGSGAAGDMPSTGGSNGTSAGAPSAAGTGVNAGSPSAGTSANGGTNSNGSAGTSGSGSSAASAGTAEVAPQRDSRGCSCSTPRRGRSGSVLASGGLLVLFVLRRNRRRFRS
jgi:hypothetical protein